MTDSILRVNTEARARCAIRLGLAGDAQKVLEKLRGLSTSANTRLSFLHLRLEFFRASGDRQGAVETLQKLTSLLPLSAEMWTDLYAALEEKDGKGYQKLGSEVDTSSHDGASLLREKGCALNSSHLRLCCLLWAKVCLDADFPSTEGPPMEDFSATAHGREKNIESRDVCAKGAEESYLNRNFAADRATCLRKYVETELSRFPTLGEHDISSDGSKKEKLDTMALTRNISLKYSRLSTFDDHAEELFGDAFIKAFVMFS